MELFAWVFDSPPVCDFTNPVLYSIAGTFIWIQSVFLEAAAAKVIFTQICSSIKSRKLFPSSWERLGDGRRWTWDDAIAFIVTSRLTHVNENRFSPTLDAWRFGSLLCVQSFHFSEKCFRFLAHDFFAWIIWFMWVSCQLFMVFFFTLIQQSNECCRQPLVDNLDFHTFRNIYTEIVRILPKFFL